MEMPFPASSPPQFAHLPRRLIPSPSPMSPPRFAQLPAATNSFPRPHVLPRFAHLPRQLIPFFSPPASPRRFARLLQQLKFSFPTHIPSPLRSSAEATIFSPRPHPSPLCSSAIIFFPTSVPPSLISRGPFPSPSSHSFLCESVFAWGCVCA
jgi:hypothetical protein